MKEFHGGIDNRFMSLLDWTRLKTAAVSTTLFMLAAYMYAYTNATLLYDQSMIYRGPLPFRITSEKWMAVPVLALTAQMNVPWLAGVLAILFMNISVYCIVDVLEVEKRWSICMIAGLCSTQSSIVCLQEYIGGNYIGILALAFACLAVWIDVKLPIKMGQKTVLATVCMAMSAGTYGAYVSMIPSLMILLLWIDIVFKGKSAKETWRKAFLYLGQFVLGMVLYYIILRVILYLGQSELNSYMGEDNLSSVSGILRMAQSIGEAYQYLGDAYLGKLKFNYLPNSLLKMAQISMVIGICISVALFWQFRKKISDRKYNMVLLIISLLILPLSINLIYVMSSGHIHYLMIFTYVIPYLFFVKEAELCVKIKRDANYMVGYAVSILYNIVICVFLYYSIVMANAVMVQWHNMYEISLSIGTRIINRVETCEGFDGTEKVYLIGGMQYNEYFGVIEEEAEILDAYLGPASKLNINGLSWAGPCGKFLSRILDSTLEYEPYASLEALEQSEEIDSNTMEQLRCMPLFPFDGSVQKIGNDIYIIFSYAEEY